MTHPISQMVDEGADVSFSVQAAAILRSPINGAQSNLLPGQVEPMLTLRNVQLGQAGRYDVVVTNPNGSATSDPATLTVQTIELDFGDAPDPTFPTTLGSNGARVRLLTGFALGKLIDPEKDGQPTADASGDGADEDGVASITPLVPGQVDVASRSQPRLVLSDGSTRGSISTGTDLGRCGRKSLTGNRSPPVTTHLLSRFRRRQNRRHIRSFPPKP
jgi:hypothetical protein